ncbi:claspin [Ctenocephalides felis]|uniref:claspin n=1 Tax=Ctenocephalides felis TaxID=7515 RepID=UPI000E6E2E25|nr:claspin [Ctenocephalides felis]
MSKMKTKSKKVIAPIKIKEEKTANNELKELSFYVDDRVALMQQVFMTIKPKKLKSMAPDCLKDLEIAQIKELCLDEVLGISTKRLKSIIQGTKCPSDTNSDSDVGEIIEHISLDEISSDDSVTFMSDEEKNKKNKPANKEMTVLELVELQARARAIRSQLALEPIKKEVEDSEDEYNDVNAKTNSKRHAPKERVTQTEKNDDAQPGPSTKPNRNYRTKNNHEILNQHPKSPVNNITSNSNIPIENEERVRTSGSEKSVHGCRRSRKKKKSHSKRTLSNDNRTRQIEPSSKQSLKVNVSFNEQVDKDDDEINLYVSDTEKQELLSDAVTNRRTSKNSESDISIVDLNNSPLIISSENENDFKDDREDGELDLEEPTLDIKKELIDDDGNKDKKIITKNVDSQSNDDLSSDEEALEENTDWKARWINSDKVKKVLVTSKLCSSIKKKQKSSQSAKNDTNTNDTTAPSVVEESQPGPERVEITGSIEEFEKLTCINKENKNVDAEVDGKKKAEDQTQSST